jgi:CheY-like chemotaxis protein
MGRTTEERQSVRVLQKGHPLARLSAIHRQGDRLTAIWHGPPPPFTPSEQVEPLVLESDDGLERRDGWLLSAVGAGPDEGPLRVEFGSDRAAPPWHNTGERQSSPAEGSPELGEEILIVDDDPETVSLVEAALEEQGWLVRTAGGGREGLAKAEESPPDVAIVDLIMPEIGGEQLCAALRRNPKFSRTRILVLSGAEDTRVVAAACDADSAIVKPFTPELLVHEVRRLVGR